MARPIKNGVDYFPKDTDFYYDDKVRLLRSRTGAKGMYIFDYILCEIYRQNGYFLKWDKDRCLLMADAMGCGCSPENISEVISVCVKVGLFDKGVLDSDGILTSAGIQRRYIRMFNSRDYIVIYKEYWLLDMSNKKDVPAGVLNKLTIKSVFGTENPEKNTENPEKNTGNTQSKIEGINIPQRESYGKTHPTLSEVKAFFSAEGLSSNPDIFFNHYEALGWKNVYNWKAKAKEWSLREKNRKNDNYGSYDLDKYEEFLNRKD